jgi:16S rRNA (guanine966-N2)-methyltransferase
VSSAIGNYRRSPRRRWKEESRNSFSPTIPNSIFVQGVPGSTGKVPTKRICGKKSPSYHLSEAGFGKRDRGMRILRGREKGRKLTPVKTKGIRPTRDNVKESIFSMIRGYVEGRTVLDLFAGTGNLGLEALSQGAKKAIFVEKDRTCLRALMRNTDLCGFQDEVEILSLDAEVALKVLRRRAERVDLVFIDPPYGIGYVDKSLRFINAHDMVSEGGVVVVEHSSAETPADQWESLVLRKRKRHGDTVISIFQWRSSSR